jgi:hypothetical protein
MSIPANTAPDAFRTWCQAQEPAVLRTTALQYTAAAQEEFELVSQVTGLEATRAAQRAAENIWRLQIITEVLSQAREEDHGNGC